MKISSLFKVSLLSFGLFVFSHFLAGSVFAELRTCCVTGSSGCDACDTSGTYWKTDTGAGLAAICGSDANCKVCNVDGHSGKPIGNACGGTSNPPPASCTQSLYVLTNPTNLQIGQSVDFYADGHQDNGDFAGMSVTVANVNPVGGTPIASVVTTSGPTCYTTNNNCRQGFRITAKANGTAIVTVKTQMKLCPACAVSGSCNKTITLNIGSVTALMCKVGASCTSSTGAFKAGASVTCKTPVLSTTELAGGSAAYYEQCTPYKLTTAQTIISKSSTTGTFAAFTIATGVTNLKCSFRHCVTATTGVTQCSNWGV